MSNLKEANKKIEEGVVSGYKKIENGVVSGYKKIEDATVSGYNRDNWWISICNWYVYVLNSRMEYV